MSETDFFGEVWTAPKGDTLTADWLGKNKGLERLGFPVARIRCSPHMRVRPMEHCSRSTYEAFGVRTVGHYGIIMSVLHKAKQPSGRPRIGNKKVSEFSHLHLHKMRLDPQQLTAHPQHNSHQM